MRHIQTVFHGAAERSGGIGCGECQTSCQSACKTSCTVANQQCEQTDVLQGSMLRKEPQSRVRRTSRES